MIATISLRISCVEKIDQLWEDFEVSARYDGLAYAERTFKSKIPADIVDGFIQRYKREHFVSFAPEHPSEYKQSQTNNGTSPPTLTLQSWADQAIAEAFPAPEKKKPKQQLHGKRQVEKELGKGCILHFLNSDRNRRRRGFKISTLYKEVTWIHQIDERTARTYLNELYKEGKVKRWEEPVILETGQKVYHHWYTAVSNPNEKYHLWLTKG
jgi:hypothetical protein